MALNSSLLVNILLRDERLAFTVKTIKTKPFHCFPPSSIAITTTQIQQVTQALSHELSTLSTICTLVILSKKVKIYLKLPQITIIVHSQSSPVTCMFFQRTIYFFLFVFQGVVLTKFGIFYLLYFNKILVHDRSEPNWSFRQSQKLVGVISTLTVVESY